MTIGFWLYLAAAAISLIILIVAVTTVGATTNEMRISLSNSGQHVSSSALNALVAATVGVSIVFGLIFAAAYVVFAFFMRRGANWARIVLLVVTVLSLTSVLSEYGIGGVRFVAGALATVLIFLKPANEYFRAVKARRAPRL